MKTKLLVLLSISALSICANEWISLFDGLTLKGWKTSTKGQIVKVENSEIHLLSKKANLWLLHEKQFANFELHLEVKMPAGSYNSGVGFRCTAERKKPLGYQCEIAEKKTGSIYAIGKGWVLPKAKNEWSNFYKVAGNCFKTTSWNKIRIHCQGLGVVILKFEFRTTGTPPFLQEWYGRKFFEKKFDKLSVLAGGAKIPQTPSP